mmetsp:Transcript_25754/g.47352  ORF Transcript_25754/g.47352 Transcript_25754/m.47352 type:complete len:217 (-) Transcript_25754:373-1023(-)
MRVMQMIRTVLDMIRVILTPVLAMIRMILTVLGIPPLGQSKFLDYISVKSAKKERGETPPRGNMGKRRTSVDDSGLRSTSDRSVHYDGQKRRTTTDSLPHYKIGDYFLSAGNGIKLRHPEVSLRASSSKVQGSSVHQEQNNGQNKLQRIQNEKQGTIISRHNQDEADSRSGLEEDKSLLEQLVDRKQQHSPKDISTTLSISDSMTNANLQSVASFV